MPAVNPDGTPGNVAADELIESAWGNAVADTIQVFQDDIATNAAGIAALVTREYGKITRAGRWGLTLDANGNGIVPFGGAEASFGGNGTETVVVCNLTDPTVGAFVNVEYVGAERTSFLIKVWSHTGAAAANVTVTVNWIAVGPPP